MSPAATSRAERDRIARARWDRRWHRQNLLPQPDRAIIASMVLRLAVQYPEWSQAWAAIFTRELEASSLRELADHAMAEIVNALPVADVDEEAGDERAT